MKTLKKVLQDWLGITALANKVVETQINEIKHTGSALPEDVSVFNLPEGDIDVVKGYRPK